MTVMQDEATVFVIDDDASMRDSLKWFLQTVGLPAETFASAEEFLASFSPDRPGCIVLDVRMPERHRFYFGCMMPTHMRATVC